MIWIFLFKIIHGTRFFVWFLWMLNSSWTDKDELLAAFWNCKKNLLSLCFLIFFTMFQFPLPKTVRCAVKSGDCASNDSKRSKWPHLLAIKTENKFNYGKYFWLWVRVWFWRVLSTWTFMMNHLKLQHNQNKFNPQQFQFPIIRQQIYELRPSQQKINWIFN